jgi:hypothetical protein
VPWDLTVRKPGGFTEPVVIVVDSDYFDIFETQGFFPEADSETRDGDTLYLSFVPPPGDRFVLTYDAYVQPSSQIGRDAEIAVLDEGRVAAKVHIDTWLAP